MRPRDVATSTSNNPIGIGLLGAGEIGSEVARVLLRNDVSQGTYDLVLRNILVRNANRTRDGIPAHLITTDPEQVMTDPLSSVVIEAIGGEEPARTYIARSLAAGKHVVTANKEAIAKHGDELLRTAHENAATIAYEASVGGGIPVLAVLSDSLNANRIDVIRAIINGTTNYILSSMQESETSFAEALGTAQSLGYAESDPASDIDAHDAVYKLSILIRLGFGASVRPHEIHREGIANIDAKDLRYAQDLGFTIKLLAIARQEPEGLYCGVHPTLVPLDVPMAKVNGVFNAIELNGDLIGPLWLQGRGAGASPTASAIIGDVIRAAGFIRNGRGPYGKLQSRRVPPVIAAMDDFCVRYYVRLTVLDRPGVLAEIAGVFGDAEISIASVLQKDSDDRRGTADLVIMTHPAREANMQTAAKRLRKLEVVASLENLIRVEDYGQRIAF